MNTKPWYLSKTLWVNFVAIVALLVQSQTEYVVSAEVQAAFLVIINFILRLITKQELEF